MARESQTTNYFHMGEAKRMNNSGKILRYMPVINGSTKVSDKTFPLPRV